MATLDALTGRAHNPSVPLQPPLQPSGSDEVDRKVLPYRMRDLCEKTGLPRQVIHFYIQQGLVPEGAKTGRNMAYYGEHHVERVRLVRQLQHERFLPLKAIRAMLEQRDEGFSPAQRRMLHDVKLKLVGVVAPVEGERETVDADALLAVAGLEPRDLDELVEAGLLAVREDTDGHRRIARDDGWMIELWGELRAVGLTRALGFTPADLGLLEEAVGVLFSREAKLVTERMGHLPAEAIARTVERALPILNTFLSRYHLTRARHFFAAL